MCQRTMHEQHALRRTCADVQAVVSHAVIITSRPNQLKIGALTLEALRLSQALEWEPPARTGKTSTPYCPRSPRKLIFHQAGASRIHSALAATVDAMAPNKVLLIYLSADAWPYRRPTAASPLHPATPPASPQQPPHAPPAWTPGAVILADTGVTLLAPLAPRPLADASAVGDTTVFSAAGGPEAALDTSAAGEGLMGLSASNSGVLTGTAGGDTQESAAHTALAQILPSVQAGPEQWPKRPAPRRAGSQLMLVGEASGGVRDGGLEAATAAACTELQSMEVHDGLQGRRLSRMSSDNEEDAAEGCTGAAPDVGAEGGSGADEPPEAALVRCVLGRCMARKWLPACARPLLCQGTLTQFVPFFCAPRCTPRGHAQQQMRRC